MMDIAGKRIAVLGAGRSGEAAGRLAVREGASVTVYDSGDAERLRPAMERLGADGMTVVCGPAALAGAPEAELAIISPGIDLGSPLAHRFSQNGVRIIGEIEFAHAFSKAPVIGITGTNGKTTTTELVATILNGCGVRTEAGGNYGKPYSELVLSGTSYDVVTLEISSFQLEAIEKFHCEISVWLNFAADHLDRYPGIEEYREAKLRIFETQTADDWAVVNAMDVPEGIAARTVTFSAHTESADYTLDGSRVLKNGESVLDVRNTRLRGTHNAENLMAALATGSLRGLEFDHMQKAVRDYSPPRHRCELVAEIDGREFINDSKATNLHALESSLRGQDGRVVLIAGGKDKGLPFETIVETVGRCASHAILIGEIREAIASAWRHAVPCETAGSVEEAVVMADRCAVRGQTVLFSPGTSSFDMFGGYEERGDAFRDAVTQLNQSKL